ncbi:L-idonate 5-dehydrogenase [Alisedimentitalea sp. MJ-SS2]|uniref:L-idonate 5-dehydrogenase n=1 Tax=Aliisedimentitalea sp. MJ-SS2 TaxID=3049795 RepID=UPI0029095C12|nr:L-idonate 5-dehydrogenase [Alisedimentitalea sp. MJ-SS2]MDU8927051.1 L-idonate 5-dehydrogenase [Alisedimentitalea sp. MJ-SS2]
MKALVIHGERDLRVEEIADEPVGAGQVRLRIRRGGICGSDLHYFLHGGMGAIQVRQPMILGHEVSGEIVEIGEGVAGLAVGDLVAVSPSRPCQACQYCRDGLPNHCENMRFYGSAMPMPHIQGAFRQELVANVSQCVPAKGLSPEEAAMAEPLSVCLHAAKQAGDLLGKRVLITGSGPIGVLMALVARRSGAAEIVVSDILDKPLDYARAAGADRVVNTRTDQDGLAAYQAGKGTMDVLFECSSAEVALATGIAAVRPRGTVVQLGMGGDMTVPMQQITVKELSLKGSFRFHTEFVVAIDLMEKGLIDVKPLLTHVYPFADHEKAFAVAADKALSMKVQFDFA